MRGISGRRPDRVIGAIAWLASLAAFVVVLVVAEPPGVPARPETAVALVRLMDAGEKRDQIVDYRFTRTLPDRRATSSNVVQARYGPAELSRSGTALTLSLPDRRFLCDASENGPECIEEQVTRATLGDAAVIGTAVALGAYEVYPAPPERIVGESAQCFRVQVHVRSPEQRLLDGLGRESVYCLAADGIVLRSEKRGPVAVDERVATSVVRDPDEAAIRRITGEYGAETDAAGG